MTQAMTRGADQAGVRSKGSPIRTALVGGALLALSVAASGCASHQCVRDNLAITDAEVARVGGTAEQALARANAAHHLAEGKFLYEVVLSDDSVKFPSAHDELSPEAEQRLVELATRLKSENRNVYLEIQGHTDSAGSDAFNNELGQARAEAVRRSLSRQGIALNRMSTISYGESAPVADNATREGRAQNRRVAIVVLT